MLLGCATLCERTVGGTEGRWELGCGLRRGAAASVEGTEEGGGGNCCRGSDLETKVMAAELKPIEVMLSLTETGWFSTGRDGLSFPGGTAVLGSVLVGWMGGWEMGPTGC